MRRFALSSLALVAAVSMIHAFAGCGSETTPEGVPDGGDEASADGSNPNPNPGTDGSTDGGGPGDAFIDQINPDATIDASTCKLVGQGCGASGECCTANCLVDGGADSGLAPNTCAPPNSACKLPGVACLNGTECCTGSCVGNLCSNKQCVPDTPAGACAKNEDCCSGNCQPDGNGGGLCARVNGGGTCKTSGNPCAGNTECCSNFCNNGTCSGAVSFCTQETEICGANFECCSGNCVKAGGALLGTCGAPLGGGASGCKPTGTVCQPGTPAGDGGVCESSCCSRSCGPFGGANGFKVCQPPSGCKPTGEVCRTDTDCCGGPGSPDPKGGQPNTCNKPAGAEFGRCNNGGACREPGSICKAGGFDSCSAENNCCESFGQPAGNCNNTPENCCKQDALGIPRCLVSYIDCTAAIPPAGTACATSADCCGNPCINNQCIGTTCVPKGGECTSNADCCPGLPCTTLPGSTKGICGGVLVDGGVQPPPDGGADAGPDGGGEGDGGVPCSLYGQTCNDTADCCNGVPCTSGRCRFP